MKRIKKIRALFCSHEYFSDGSSEGKYGILLHYRCSKCGKCIKLQYGTTMYNTRS